MMKIVELNNEYFEKIKKKWSYYPQHKVGLQLYYKGSYFFIPITSQKKEYNGPSRVNQTKYVQINDKNGTLLIRNYIYTDFHFSEPLEKSKTVESEIISLKSKSEEIIKKLKFQINYSRGRLDKEKKKMFEEFYKEKFNPSKNQMFAKRYMREAMTSMSIIEKVNSYEETIDIMIDYKCFGKQGSYEVETINRLKMAWERLEYTLAEKIDSDYVIETNRIIAQHQAAVIGKFRDGENSVSGEFVIPVPNLEKIRRLLEKTIYPTIDVALDVFYSIILNQWFFDGNKRTAFLITNKILINNGFGILLILKDEQEEFEKLLYKCYAERGIKSKEKFIKFLKEECIKVYL